MRIKENSNIFISYSHIDASLVNPVVSLLRSNRSLVFLDKDTILAGKKWKSEITEAISRSDLVIIFWCKHAKQSNEVRDELNAAINLKKNILPLLLDRTPLPPEMKEYQWIDFRSVVGSSHRLINLSPSTISLNKPVTWFTGHSISILVILTIAVIIGIGFISLFKMGPVVYHRIETFPSQPVDISRHRLLSVLFNLLIISFFAGLLTFLKISGSIFKNPVKTKKYIANVLEKEISMRLFD